MEMKATTTTTTTAYYSYCCSSEPSAVTGDLFLGLHCRRRGWQLG